MLMCYYVRRGESVGQAISKSRAILLWWLGTDEEPTWIPSSERWRLKGELVNKHGSNPQPPNKVSDELRAVLNGIGCQMDMVNDSYGWDHWIYTSRDGQSHAWAAGVQ